MLMTFNKSSYFDSNAVVRVSEFTGHIPSGDAEKDDTTLNAIRVALITGETVEIRGCDINYVVKSLNDQREKEQQASLNVLRLLAGDVNRIFELMAQDGVLVKRL